MLKIFTLVIFFQCFAITSFGQSIQFENAEWEDIVALAKTSDKLIFIDGYTDWCASCKLMDEYVFTQSKGGSFYNKNFINVKMNMESGMGPLFVSRYGVTKYPVFLYLTWDGSLVYSSDGYKDVSLLIEEGEKALQPDLKTKAFKERFNEGDRNPDFLYHYSYYLLEENDDTFRKMVPLYLATQEYWNSPDNLQYIFDFVEDFDSELFQHMAKNKYDYATVVGAEEFNDKFNALIKAALNGDGNPISLQRREEVYHVAYPTIADQMITEYKLDFYSDEGDDEAYANTAYYYYTTYYGTEEEIMQDIALIDEYVDSDEARKFVKATYENYAKKEDSPQSWLSLASYNLRKQRFKQAKELGKKAKKMATSNDLETNEYKEFLKEVRHNKKMAKRASRG